MLAPHKSGEGAQRAHVVLFAAPLPGCHLGKIVREIKTEPLGLVAGATDDIHNVIHPERVEHERINVRHSLAHLNDQRLDAPQQSRILRLQLRGQLVRARLYRGAQVARHPVLRNAHPYQARPVAAPEAVIYYRLERRRPHCRIFTNAGPCPIRRNAGEAA